jgi:class 3 adenylate cyclase
VTDQHPDEAEDLAEAATLLGLGREAITRVLESDDPRVTIFDPVLLPAIGERTVSAREIEASGGLRSEEIVNMMEAFGLPGLDHDTAAFSPAEAAAMVELGRRAGIYPEELRLQVSRAYGRLLARIAQTEVQLFLTYIVPRIAAGAGHRMEVLRAVRSAAADLLSTTDPLISGVHRRWIEHELYQVAALQAESVASDRLPGSVLVTVLFCDLKDFTAYANLEGDAAAVAVIDAFMATVMRERGDHVKLMKSLGDGVMLCYDDACQAIAAGARIIAAIHSGDGPGVHASAHHGIAIAREGDYFGGAVNLAARLLAAAARDELIVTAAVVGATDDRFRWEPVGTFQLRGIGDPVEGFRLVQ